MFCMRIKFRISFYKNSPLVSLFYRRSVTTKPRKYSYILDFLFPGCATRFEVLPPPLILVQVSCFYDHNTLVWAECKRHHQLCEVKQLSLRGPSYGPAIFCFSYKYYVMEQWRKTRHFSLMISGHYFRETDHSGLSVYYACVVVESCASIFLLRFRTGGCHFFSDIVFLTTTGT